MGRMARNKGKVGERKLATELRLAFPEYADEIRRGWQVREGDDDPDVIVPFDVWFESKFLARFNSAPLTQAIADSKGRGIPVAVVRTNRKEPIGILRWSDLLVMLQVFVRSRRDGRRSPVQPECGDPPVRAKRRRKDVPAGPPKRWRVRLRRG